MGALSERLLVEIDGRTSGAVSEMGKLSAASDKAAKSTDQLAVKTKTSHEQIAKSSRLSGAALKTGLATGAAIAGVAVVKFGLDAAHAASDMNESVSKAGVVFGKSAEQVVRFGDSAAKSIGLSKQEAIESAATFGNLFVALKVGQQPAAQMSTAMVKLAGDLASFNNADPSQVLEDLRSGLLGEAEPLRKYGVALNEAAVQQEAMRETGKKSAAQLTEGEKVIARYQLILKNTTTAQGDFARTSTGVANQQRIANAQFKDFQANLGKLFIPVLLGATTAANELLGPLNALVGAAQHLPEPVVKAALAAGALILGMKALKLAGAGLGLVLDKLAIDFTGMALAEDAAVASGARLGLSLGGIVGAMAGAIIVAHSLKDRMVDLAQSIGALPKSPFAGTGVGVVTPEQQRSMDAIDRFADHLQRADISKFNDDIRALSAASSSLVSQGGADEINKLDDAFADLLKTRPREAVAAFSDLTLVLQRQGVPLSSLSDLFPKYTAAVEGSLKSGHAAALGFDDVGKKALDAASKLERYRLKLLAIGDTHLDTVSTDLAFRDSLDAIGAGLKDLDPKQRRYAQALDVTTQAGRDELRTVIASIEAAKARAKSVADAATAAGHGAQANSEYDRVLKKGIATIREQAAAHHLNKKQIDDLIATYLKVPATKKTAVTAPGAKSAEDRMNAVTRAANDIPRTKTTTVRVSDQATRVITRIIDELGRITNRTITYRFVSDMSSFVMPGAGAKVASIRDSGGPVRRGEPYVIGLNRKPELFVPEQDGTVLTLPQDGLPLTRPTLGAGGRGTGNTYITLNASFAAGANLREAGRQIAEQLAAYVNGGGTVKVAR